MYMSTFDWTLGEPDLRHCSTAPRLVSNGVNDNRIHHNSQFRSIVTVQTLNSLLRMLRIINRQRFVSPAQSLNIGPRLLHARSHLVQDPVLLLIILSMVLIRSRIRVVGSSRVG